MLALAPPAPVQLCPELRAHQASDVFTVWAAAERESAKPQAPPFWAAVWPGAALLARLLLDEPERVTGKRVFDLGCGGAVAGLAAKRAGADRVIAMDIDALALRAAQANAGLNQVEIDTELADALPILGTRGEGDAILVAEMFYEREAAHALEQELRAACARGATVLIADGERPFTPSRGMRALREARLAVPFGLEGVDSRRTRVFEFAPV
jgi:predicted nicotinamide N-methyase